MTTIFFRFTHFANCILHLVINTTPFFFILDIRHNKFAKLETFNRYFNYLAFEL